MDMSRSVDARTPWVPVGRTGRCGDIFVGLKVRCCLQFTILKRKILTDTRRELWKRPFGVVAVSIKEKD